MCILGVADCLWKEMLCWTKATHSRLAPCCWIFLSCLHGLKSSSLPEATSVKFLSLYSQTLTSSVSLFLMKWWISARLWAGLIPVCWDCQLQGLVGLPSQPGCLSGGRELKQEGKESEFYSTVPPSRDGGWLFLEDLFGGHLSCGPCVV